MNSLKDNDVAYLGLTFSIFQKSLWWYILEVGSENPEKLVCPKEKTKTKKTPKPEPLSKFINLIPIEWLRWVN